MELPPILAFLTRILVSSARTHYKTKDKYRQRRQESEIDKRLELYSRINAHYDSPGRYGAVHDWPDATSQKLISEARLLNIPAEIVFRMEEEEQSRVRPFRSTAGLSADVVQYQKAQAILRAIREDRRVTIEGRPRRDRIFDMVNRLGWFGYDMTAKYRRDPLFWWVFAIMPVLGLIGIAVVLLLHFYGNTSL